MTIAIASPISCGILSEYIDGDSKEQCGQLSRDNAPAVTTLAKELLDAGHHLIVFTLDPIVTDYKTFQGKNLTIHVGPAYSSNKLIHFIEPLFGRNIYRVNKLFSMNRESFDVISVHWTRDYAIAAQRFIGKCPVFITVRDIIPYVIKQQKIGVRNYNWRIIYMMNEIVMHNNHFNFIANSEYTAAMIREYWKRDVPVIPNPILDKYLRLENIASSDTENYIITSISVSQPDDKRKNIVALLRAFQYVRKVNTTVTLNLVGQTFTSDNPKIQKLKREGLLSGVMLCGSMSHDEVLKLLCESNLMVHPSLEETFGNTLIEAMAVGCPVLGGEKSGAVPYVLNHGKAGYLCNVEDPKAIGDAILNIIRHQNESYAKAKEAKLYCKNTFSSKLIAEKYVEMFNEAISR